MPAPAGAIFRGSLRGFRIGNSVIFISLAVAAYALHTSHIALDHALNFWEADLMYSTHVRFGWRYGVVGIYMPTASVIALCVPDRLHSLWLFSACLVVRQASLPLRDWLLCDGPSENEAAMLNLNIVRLGCYFVTLGALFAASVVHENLGFDVQVCLSALYIGLRVLTGIVPLALVLYLFGKERRQSLLRLCWKLLWPIWWVLDVSLPALVEGIESGHLQFFGSPAGHWWHQRAFRVGEVGEQYDYEQSTILFPNTPQGNHQQEPRIRLLKLQRRWPFGDICGELLPLSLAAAEACRYDAISYCWGDDKDMRQGIFINGKYMAVTRNAYEVLHGRSSYFRDRYLWIDAICIKQNDPLEMNFQIPLMKEIYSRSERTIVWLGFKKSACHVVDFFPELVRAQEGYMLSNSELHAKFGALRRSPKFLALIELLENEWFTRAWVIQEVAMAKKIHVIYGGQYIYWSLFIAGLRVLHSPQMAILLTSTAQPLVFRNIPRGLIHVMNIEELRDRVQSKQPISLSEILHNSFQCRATKPEDKVFALQGMALPELPDHMRPNCFSTTKDVYLRTSQYLLTHDYLIWILPFAGVGHMRKHKSLPSWVPDWSEPPQAPLLTDPRPHIRTYNASRSLTQPLKSNNETLILKCLYVDKVLEAGLAKHEFHTSYEGKIIDSLAVREVLQKVLAEALSLAQSRTNGIYGTGTSLTDAFWRTLIGDSTYKGDHPAPSHWGQYYEIARRMYEMDGGLLQRALREDPESIQQLQAPTEEESIKATKFTTVLGARSNYRRFCVAEGGRMGWVPLLTAPGDIIVVILGAQVPFVLRPLGETRTRDDGVEMATFEIVGECYMHGIMDGHVTGRAGEARDFLIV